jgi:hypothetical protein
MAFIETHCITCGCDFNLDIGDKTPEQVQKLLEAKESFHCDAGHHFEMDSPVNHWVLGNRIETRTAPTEEQWYNQMTEKHGRLMTSDQMQAEFEVEGFAFGACMAKNRKTKQDACLEYITSPKGERYYYE